MLAIKHYHSDKTTDKILEILLRAKHQFNVIQHVLPIERESNKLSIRKRINNVLTIAEKINFLSSRMEDLREAGDSLERGEINYHDHILLIQVFSDTEKSLIR